MPQLPSELFAERLATTRKNKGLSQSDLAAKAGLQASAISHFEGGKRKPSFENLRRLANALHVTTDYLLGRVDDDGSIAQKADPLYRDIQKLTDGDRELAADFLKLLAERNRSQAVKKGAKTSTPHCPSFWSNRMLKLKITLPPNTSHYRFQLGSVEETFDCHEPLYGVMNWLMAQGHGEMTLELEHVQEEGT